MTKSFAELGLREEILKAISLLGFEEPTRIQERCIPPLLEGKDIIGKARTGSGKTAAFALPIIQRVTIKSRKPKALILAPTRELALQVSDAITTFCAGQPIRILSIYGGTPYKPQFDALKRGVSIVVGTPGRILDMINKGGLILDEVEYVVLDEADEMLRMGFIDDVETILSKTNPNRQTALFSATMPPPIRKIGTQFMQNPIEIEVESKKLSTDHITQLWISVQQRHKAEALHRVLESWVTEAALIFTRTRQGCAELADILTERGLIADALHGDMGQEARERVLKRLRQNKIRFVVATDVAARGIDVNHISHVINFDLSNDPESYVHRIGRTGRAGREGTAVSFITPSENQKLRYFERKLKVKMKESFAPTRNEITQQRWSALKAEILLKSNSDVAKRIESWTTQLMEESQLLPRDVCSLLLQEIILLKGIDIEEKNDVLSRTGKKKGKKRNSKNKLNFDERNEQDIVLNIGRRDNIQVGDVLWAVSTLAEINSNMIGKIKVMDRKCFVGLPRDIAQPLIEGKRQITIRGKEVTVFEKLGTEKQSRRFSSNHPPSYRNKRRGAKKRR